MFQIKALYRHPVKGLSPEAIDAADLIANEHFPHDRLFALENGPSGFDPAAPEHLPKTKFLMLMRNARLAKLETRFDPESRRLTIRQGGLIACAASVDDPAGAAAIARFFETFMGAECRGSVKLIAAPQGYRFMDSRSGFISLLNLASVQALAASIGRTQLDPRRFRANVHLEGLEPWQENDCIGRQFRLGEARIEIIKRIERCAATDVDPATGERDTRLVSALESAFKHHDCGIYARIIASGRIALADRLTAL